MNTKTKGSTALWVIGAVLLVFVVLPLVGIGLGIITLPFNVLQSKVDLNKGVINTTYDTSYCLANYEWFKDTYNAIQQADVKIQNGQDQLNSFLAIAPKDTSTWSFTQQQQYGNLNTDITGAKNYKADLVGQYNSRTTQLNRVACKELPLFVNP
jgi:hypothetical protein